LEETGMSVTRRTTKRTNTEFLEELLLKYNDKAFKVEDDDGNAMYFTTKAAADRYLDQD
jgi:hypothetical protein